MRRTLLLFFLVLLFGGCGRVTQIDPDNRRVMQALQTAVSSRNMEWLEATVKLIDEKRAADEMSDDEYTAFEPIIARARAGDWDGAQKGAFALSEGQMPTPEDIEKIKPAAAEK